MLNFSTASIVWLVLVVLFALLEASTVSLVSIWFAAGAAAALVASAFTDNVLVQVVVFVLVSVAVLALVRPLLKKHRLDKAPALNADRNVGRTATVLTAVTPAVPGRARLDGVDWNVRSAEVLAPGQLCVVTAVDGTTLTVRSMAVPVQAPAAGAEPAAAADAAVPAAPAPAVQTPAPASAPAAAGDDAGK